MAYKMKGSSFYSSPLPQKEEYTPPVFDNKRDELKSLRKAKRGVIKQMKNERNQNIEVSKVMDYKEGKKEARDKYKSEKKEFKAKAREVKREVKAKYKK